MKIANLLIGLVLLIAVTLYAFTPVLDNAAYVFAQAIVEKHDDHEGEDRHDDHVGEDKHDDHEGEEKHDDHAGEDKHDDHEGEDGHDEHGGSKFGPGKAITEVREKDQAFQLSKKATALLRIKTKNIRFSKGQARLPEKSLVEFQQHTAFYRFREGWYELVEVKLLARKGRYVFVEAQGLKNRQKIVVSGVPLLHVAYLEASGQGGKGHAH